MLLPRLIHRLWWARVWGYDCSECVRGVVRVYRCPFGVVDAADVVAVAGLGAGKCPSYHVVDCGLV